MGQGKHPTESEIKIARAKNNCHDLRVMAKKVGSNFFLMNRRLSANLNYAFVPLSGTEGGAASAAPSTFAISEMVSREGFEPPTNALRGHCSTIELPAHSSAPERNRTSINCSEDSYSIR